MAGSDPREVPGENRSRPASGRQRRFDFLAPGFRLKLGFLIDRAALAPGASLEREIDAARGLPWLAVAFAGGTLAYFLLPSEPWAPALVLLAVALAVAARKSAGGRAGTFRLLLVLALVAAGAAAAKLRTDWLATPTLERQVTATLTGFVEGREGRRGGYRLTIRVVAIAGARLERPPHRVTVTVRGEAPRVGEGVTMLARLRPPSGPALPGSYDFARNAFYQGIGAAGFAYGAAKTVDLGPPPLAITLRMPLEALREAIRARILAVLPGDTGRVASALVIGDAGGISRDGEEALRQSGLAHVLSVSGLHMVLVAGATFWAIRALLALVPALALRRPIKKWAAAGALAVTFFYLLISGLDVAAQRSFIMTAIVFGAILAERRAISMRNVALAAFVVLALAPESILDAGFQMSFAATIALVAGFEAMARRKRRGIRLPGDTTLAGRIIGFGAILIGGLALTSLLGGIGTTPFALYHFQRMAPLSIVANVVAMPLIDFLVMPAALIAVLLMPFGLAQPFLMAMGIGIDGMLAIATTVADWSAGSGGAAMPSAAALLLFIAGFLWLALMGERWRLAGLLPMLVGSVLAFLPERPDLVVSAGGRVVAIRGADGRYGILAAAPERFETAIWLRADGDARPADDEMLRAGTHCDRLGCIGRLADGRIVALALDRGAFDEDCRRAALVVTPMVAPAACKRMTAVIDRALLVRTGALALTLAQERGLPEARPPPAAGEADLPQAGSDFDDPGEAAAGPWPDEGDRDTPPPDIADSAVASVSNRPAEQEASSGDLGPDQSGSADDALLRAAFTVTSAYPAERRAWMPPPQRP